MTINFNKDIYNNIVKQKIENEQVIAQIYSEFDNYTQEEKLIALQNIDDFNIINEEFQKYIILYNQSVKNEKQSYEYIVIFGDTIQSIAQNATGDYNNWKEIMRFNNLSDINIEVGSIILIPENL